MGNGTMPLSSNNYQFVLILLIPTTQLLLVRYQEPKLN